MLFFCRMYVHLLTHTHTPTRWSCNDFTFKKLQPVLMVCRYRCDCVGTCRPGLEKKRGVGAAFLSPLNICWSGSLNFKSDVKCVWDRGSRGNEQKKEKKKKLPYILNICMFMHRSRPCCDFDFLFVCVIFRFEIEMCGVIKLWDMRPASRVTPDCSAGEGYLYGNELYTVISLAFM